jgi:hypothetical protein
MSGEEAGNAALEIKTYSLDPAAFERVVKGRMRRRLAWLLPFFLCLLALMLGLLVRAQPDVVETLPYSAPVVLALVTFGWLRAVRKQMKEGRAAWDSYRLTVGPNVLRRVIVNLPPVEIVRTEVTRIVESPVEGFSVTTADRHRFVFVPRQLVGFAEVRAHLSGWKAVEPAKRGRQAALGMLWSAVLLGCWLGTGIIPDIRLAMLSGAVLLVAVGFLIREILKQKIVANERKAALVAGMFMFMLAPFARLLLHLVYHVDPRWPP